MFENKLNGYSENLSEEEISLRVEFVRRVQLISRDMGASDENIVDTMLLFGTVVLSAYQDEDYSDFISGGFRYSYEGFDFSRLIHVSLERSSFPEEYREAIRDFFNTSERLHQIKQNLFNAYVSLFHDLGLYRNSELTVLVDILDYFLFQNRKEISGPFLLNPRLSKLIIEQADINPGDRVHDFSAGYGDLLIQADNLFQEKQRNSYWGCCKYLRNYVIAYLRSMLRNAQNTSFELRNIFEDSNCHYTKELFDVVLSAPPLGLKFTQDDRHRYWDYQYKTSDYIGLYIQQSLRQLKQDGRLVLLVPWNFLCTQKKSDVGFRRWLLENYCVERVIALPAGALINTDALSAILVMRNSSPVYPIEFQSYAALGKSFRLTHQPKEFFIQKHIHLSNEEPSKQPDTWQMYREDFGKDCDLSPTNRKDLLLSRYLEEIKENKEIVQIPLGKCCDLIAGTNIKSNELTEDPKLGRRGYLRISDIQNTRTKEPVKYLSRVDSLVPSLAMLRENDVVIARSGSVGKTGVVTKKALGSVCSSGLFILRPKDNYLSSAYLAAYLNSDACQEWLKAFARGGTIQHLDKRTLSRLTIAIPMGRHRQNLFGEFDISTDIINLPSQDFWPMMVNSLSKQDEVASELRRIVPKLSEIKESDSIVAFLSGLAKVISPLRRFNPGFGNKESGGLFADKEGLTWFTNLSELIDKYFFGCPHKIQELSSGVTQFYLLKELINSLNGLMKDEIITHQIVSEFMDRFIDLVEGAKRKIYHDGGVAIYSFSKGEKNKFTLKVNNNTQLPLYKFQLILIGNHGISQRGTWDVDIEIIEAQTDANLIFDSGKSSPDSLTSIDYFWNAQSIDGEDLTGEGRLEISLKVDTKGPELTGSPYVCGDPISPDKKSLFFGRDELIFTVRRQIINMGNVVLLEGNRRAGKTSILKQLEGSEAIDGWLGVYCSLQGAKGSPDGYGVPTEEVFRAMANSIARALFDNRKEAILPNGIIAKSKLGISKACREGISIDDPFSDFKEYLEVVLEQLEEQNLRLFLMMDEFDKLQEGIDSGVTSPQVPENIRYLVQSYSNFSAILTGSRRLKRLRQEYWSALFGLGTRVGVTALSTEDSELLVKKPVEGFLEYDSVAVKEIISICAYQPFLIQSLCNRIYDIAARNGIYFIDEQTVNDAAIAFVMDNEHFRSLWGYAGSDLKRFLLAYFARNEVESFPDLHYSLEEHGIDIRDEDLINDLDFLIELELIKKNSSDQYSLEVPLMTSWIKHQHDFEALRVKAVNETGDFSGE